MASGRERVIRRRIKSVQSTKKITRAMELIAASRIVRAQQGVAAARPYSERITEVLRHLAGAGALDSAVLKPRAYIRTVAVLAITADRGLAGAYNATVIRAAERRVQQVQQEGREYSLIVAGRKAESYFRYRGYRIDAAFTGFSEQPRYEDARRVAESVVGRYDAGEVDQFDVVYTRFLSVGSQRVLISRLLPIETQGLVGAAGGGTAGGGTGRGGTGGGAGGGEPQAAYEFEPGPEHILELLVRPYVEARLFAAMLDAAASEHAARQRAMKSATDNAEELIKTLSIVANKVRQAGITTEIMEIVGGAEALRQASA